MSVQTRAVFAYLCKDDFFLSKKILNLCSKTDLLTDIKEFFFRTGTYFNKIEPFLICGSKKPDQSDRFF